MVGQYHRLNQHELKQTPGDGGQGSLACGSSWVHKEQDIPEQLNKNKEYTSNKKKNCKYLPVTIFTSFLSLSRPPPLEVPIQLWNGV